MDRQSFTRSWLIIGAAFFFVILILAAWFISLEATEQDALTRYNQQQLLVVEGTASGIKGMFSDLGIGLSSLVALSEIQYFDEETTRSEITRQSEQMRSFGVTDIGVLDADGTAKVFAVNSQLEGIDYSWREYFKEAQSSSGNTASTPIVELQRTDQGEQGFLIAVPIFETATDINHPTPTGDFAGVLISDLTFDIMVQRYISPFKSPGNGQIFLINQEYDVLWSSSSDLTGTNLLVNDQETYIKMVDRMGTWDMETAQGEAYEFTEPLNENNIELIAFAPVIIGNELMAVGVWTPGEDVIQTSLSIYQSQEFVLSVSVLTILIGVVLGGSELRREVRRRLQAEDALNKREMKQAIISERNRMASDLHDSATQGIYGIVLHADAAMKQLSTGQTDKVKSYLKEIKEAGKESLAEMRLLIFELRPQVLEKDGLVAALENRLYAIERRAGLKAEIRSAINSRLPLNVGEGLYRIAQEAFNNIFKHANAQNIQVDVQQKSETVSLIITDDGEGFDVQSNRKNSGMGLTSMEERAAKLDGTIKIESAPGEGTSIHVEVKL